MNQVGLSAEEVGRIFPFYILFNRDLRIYEFGPSLKRLMGEGVGSALPSLFDLVDSSLNVHFDTLFENRENVVCLMLKSKHMKLKGQIVSNQDPSLVFFLGSPWISNTDGFESVHKLGLSLKDFSLHDNFPDYMILLQTKEVALADTRRINKNLEAKSRTMNQFSENLRSLHGIMTSEHIGDEDLFVRYLQKGCEIFGMESAWINEFRGDTPVLRAYYTRMTDDSLEGNLSMNDSIYRLVASKGKTVIWTGSAQALTAGITPSDKIPQACCATPIRTRNLLYGTLCFVADQPRGHRFEVQEIEFLELMAKAIGSHLEQEEMRREKDVVDETLNSINLRFKAIADASLHGIYVMLPDGSCVYSNQTYQKLVGLTEKEVLGEGWSQAIHPEDRERVSEAWYRSTLTRSQFQSLHRFLHADGKTVWTSVLSAEILDKDELVGYVGTVEDITERMAWEETLKTNQKELRAHRDHLEELVTDRTAELRELNNRLRNNQSQLVHSEKMASLGQLAAGIAHEINNPLNYILVNVTSMDKYMASVKRVFQEYFALHTLTESDPRLAALLEKIDVIKEEEDLDFILTDIDSLIRETQEGGSRVREIIQNLRTFARVDESDMKVVNINDGLEATLKIIVNELKYKCTIKKVFGDIPAIKCFPGQLNQVFMNLLVNASQAIQEKGEIGIISELVDGEVRVRISDTGHGIPPENISKLFTPFFTTKEVGQGTGLGLSISYGIIKKHGGRIEVQSEVGKGTTFTVCLPQT